MNRLYLNALSHSNFSGEVPLWIMRQAGRYLPTYQKIRKTSSLIDMFHNSEVIEQVTLLPIEEFGFDAAILFSDILVVLEALGVSLSYKDGVGPQLFPRVSSEKEVLYLLKEKKDVEDTLSYVFEGIKALKKRLSVPLIGFCGGPLTVISYLLESENTEKLKATKQWIYQREDLVHTLLSLVTDVTEKYLAKQIDSGVDSIQIFDSWAGSLPLDLFKRVAKPYLKRLVDFVKAKGVPVVIFSRGTSLYFEEFLALGATAISCDGQRRVYDLRSLSSQKVVLQGDLDPELLLYGTTKQVQEEARKILKGMKDDPGFIFNLGHGILPQTPVDNVKALVATVRETSLVTK